MQMSYTTLNLKSTDNLHLEQEIIWFTVRVTKRPWYLKLFLNPKIEEVEVKCKIKAIGTGFIMVELGEAKVINANT